MAKYPLLASTEAADIKTLRAKLAKLDGYGPKISGHWSIASRPVLRPHGYEYPSGFSTAVWPARFVLPIDFTNEPQKAIRFFFDALGSIWDTYQGDSSDTETYLKGGFVTAVGILLGQAAYAAGIPITHNAYKTIFAMHAAHELLSTDSGRRLTEARRQVYTLGRRLMDGSEGLVFSNRKQVKISKIRQLIVEAIARHCSEYLPRGGASNPETFRKWIKTNPGSSLYPPIVFGHESLERFEVRINNDFKDAGQIMRMLLASLK